MNLQIGKLKVFRKEDGRFYVEGIHGITNVTIEQFGLESPRLIIEVGDFELVNEQSIIEKLMGKLEGKND